MLLGDIYLWLPILKIIVYMPWRMRHFSAPSNYTIDPINRQSPSACLVANSITINVKNHYTFIYLFSDLLEDLVSLRKVKSYIHIFVIIFVY